jgi:hypothetical protein
VDSDNLGSNPYKDSGSGHTLGTRPKPNSSIYKPVVKKIVYTRYKKFKEKRGDPKYVGYSSKPKSDPTLGIETEIEYRIRIGSIEPWDLSDVFYATRDDLNEMGYNVDDLSQRETREDIHSYVKDVCDSIGIYRHQIGIYPDERASGWI